jgi:hypothetical protein
MPEELRLQHSSQLHVAEQDKRQHCQLEYSTGILWQKSKKSVITMFNETLTYSAILDNPKKSSSILKQLHAYQYERQDKLLKPTNNIQTLRPEA